MGAPTKDTAAESTATDNSNISVNMVTSTATMKNNKTTKRTTAHRIALGDITLNNLGQLKKLNTVLFPVHYSEKFYKDVLEVGEFAKFAYFNDCCVGAVCCRKEQIKESSNQGTTSDQAKLYIMTLGVLAPYRNLGIGTKLLSHILQHATLPTSHPKFVEIYLHVQTSNEEALAFYKKYNFEIIATVEGYYKKISPPDAYVLSRKL